VASDQIYSILSGIFGGLMKLKQRPY